MPDLVLLVGGAVVALLALKLVSLLLGRRGSETLSFRGPLHGVEIVLHKGEVIVRGDDDRRDARVRRRLHHGLRRPRVREHVEDGILRLEVSSGLVRYEVDVPARAAVVVRGRAATATVVGMAGPVELRSGRGSLEGRALSGDRVAAVTAAGSIRLSFDRPPEDVDVATDDGPVDLRLPGGPYDVDAGDARVGVACLDGAHRRVRARAGHGPVRIEHR